MASNALYRYPERKRGLDAPCMERRTWRHMNTIPPTMKGGRMRALVGVAGEHVKIPGPSSPSASQWVVAHPRCTDLEVRREVGANDHVEYQDIADTLYQDIVDTSSSTGRTKGKVCLVRRSTSRMSIWR